MSWLGRLIGEHRPRGTLTLLEHGAVVIGWPLESHPTPEEAHRVEERLRSWLLGETVLVLPFPVDVFDRRSKP